MKSNFGNNLRYLRKQKNITQEKLGDQVFLSFQQIGHYETGRAIPPADKLISLSKYFGVPANQLWEEDLTLKNAG